ncbi:MAG: NAD+ synthase [Candidatus Omnitrophica bacterium]|nr:NAD+ synthase [Candidatus Omnitrophota bacterium]
MIRVALAQINPVVGDIKSNAFKIIDFIERARKRGVDILAFPESSLPGYPPEDLLYKPYFIAENKRFLEIIRKKCEGISVLIGFVDKDKNRIYNACAFIQNKIIKNIYHKISLPNYGVFDERRYFTPGDSLSIFELGQYRFALTICEDIWEKGVLSGLRDKKLDFLINISASPFHLDKISLRRKVLANAGAQAKCFVFYCNLVGGQDELVFDGTSKIVSNKGHVVASARRFEEDLFVFDFEKNKKYPSKKIIIKSQEEAFSALKLGLYDYVNKNKFTKVVVGVSGGIDSAVVLGLSSIALGKDNVFGLIMPSKFSSPQTFHDAVRVCDNLGVKYKVINIDRIYRAYLKELKKSFEALTSDVTQENIQARIRGNILMAFSNKFGYLVLNTGNKSEVSCGYCTLYGDMVGGFGVLKDVPKLLVYKIADHVNKVLKFKAIPSSIFNRPPTAELKPGQKDSDTLPVYEQLDPILKLYIEDNLSLEKITKLGYKKELVARIISMVDSNEYKRRQSPIGIKITPRAFGKDRRMPITNRFRH